MPEPRRFFISSIAARKPLGSNSSTTWLRNLWPFTSSGAAAADLALPPPIASCFFASFLVLFVLTGVGNGSTFQMIPKAFQAHHVRAAGPGGEPVRRQALAAARLETAAALGFIAAIGAYGGWLIPQGYGVSTSLTGGPVAALWGLVAFYLVCLGVVWRNFLRPAPAGVEPAAEPERELAEAGALSVR